MNLFLQYLKTITFRRFLNFIGCEISLFLSRILKKDIIWGLPWSVSIEPTTSCNLQCSQCATGAGLLTRPKGNLSLQDFKTIINKIEKQVFYLTLYFQGEPFLNRFLFDMIRFARQKKIFVSTSTNGHFISEEFARKIIESGLNKLIISIDGTFQKSYSSYRKNGDLDVVMKGLENLLSAKKSMKSSLPYVEVQFLVFKHNEHEISEIMKMAQQKGIDRVVLKTAQIIKEEDFDDLLPSDQVFSRYFKSTEGKFERKKHLRNYCSRMRNACAITWDGKLVPCCFDKNADYSCGNILESDFQVLIKNKIARNFRNSVLKERKTIEICRNCIE